MSSMKKNNRSNKKTKGKVMLKTNAQSGEQVYTGPLRLWGVRDQQETVPIELTNLQIITSSGAGSIATVFSFGLAALQDSGTYEGVYEEYRVLSATWEWIPNAKDSVIAAVAYAPLVVAVDRDSNTALTSYTSAWNLESAKADSINSKQVMTARASGSQDLLWQPISTTSFTPFYIKLWATGLTATTAYGIAFWRTIVQFRARF
jgi:hypothetical protein